MRVHVLGGSGFLGGRVVRRLVDRGYVVTSTARSAAAAEKIRAVGAEPIHGDLLVDADIDRTISESRAQALVTSVSLGFGFGPRIVSAAVSAGVERAVFVSTTSVFTKLDSATKPIRERAEQAIMDAPFGWTIVRPTMIYGHVEDGNMAKLLRFIARFGFMPLPAGGRGLQQPVHVDDVADAVMVALDRDQARGKAYDLAGPEPLTFAEVVAQAGDAVGRSVRTIRLPLRPVVAATRLAERMHAPLPIRAEQLERLAEDKAFDISAAVADLSFAPRPLFDGLRAEARSLGISSPRRAAGGDRP